MLIDAKGANYKVYKCGVAAVGGCDGVGFAGGIDAGYSVLEPRN